MAAAQPGAAVTGGVRSLEVRWIFPGQLEATVAGWFARFPVARESREDSYLRHPRLPGLSVKVRGGRALEVKMFRGSPGVLEVAGRACGRLESWQKWSFPLGPASRVSAEAAGWTPVSKRISRVRLGSDQSPAGVPGLGVVAGCTVELTGVRMGGEPWWTLGFEATGPEGLLRGELEASAALVFAQALPGGVTPGADASRSYAEWLGGQLGAGAGEP
jgi:hypothetical protein